MSYSDMAGGDCLSSSINMDCWWKVECHGNAQMVGYLIIWNTKSMLMII